MIPRGWRRGIWTQIPVRWLCRLSSGRVAGSPVRLCAAQNKHRMLKWKRCWVWEWWVALISWGVELTASVWSNLRTRNVHRGHLTQPCSSIHMCVVCFFQVKTRAHTHIETTGHIAKSLQLSAGCPRHPGALIAIVWILSLHVMTHFEVRPQSRFNNSTFDCLCLFSHVLDNEIYGFCMEPQSCSIWHAL